MVDGKKALPYTHVIVAYGTAIVGLPSQIVPMAEGSKNVTL